MNRVEKGQPKLRVILADDEPLARLKLQRLINDVPWLDLVGEASDTHIRMPDGTGIDVMKTTHHKPHVIFTTAYDSYAVTAFELGALDYLLKPFSKTRFLSALERACQTGKMAPIFLKQLTEADNNLSKEKILSRIFVPDGDHVLLINVNDIERFEGQGDYALVYVKDRKYLVRIRLKELEKRLDPTNFVRVHRSHIINLNRIKKLTPIGNGRFKIILKSDVIIPGSRQGSRLLRRYFK